jgi:hypothetical protein
MQPGYKFFIHDTPIGEACFKSYVKFRNWGKVTQALARDGMYNTKTNKPYSIRHVNFSAWRWAINCPLDAYEALKENKNIDIKPENWERLIVRKARSTFYSEKYGYRNGFRSWLEYHGLYEQYKHYDQFNPRDYIPNRT